LGGTGEAGAQHARSPPLTERLAEESTHLLQLPRQTYGRRPDLGNLVGVVGIKFVIGWGGPSQRARFEEIADAGESPNPGQTHLRVEAVLVDESEFFFVPQSNRRRQIRVDAPRVLNEQADFANMVAIDRRGRSVLLGSLVERDTAGEGRYPSRQGRIQSRGGVELRLRGAGKIRRGEETRIAVGDRIIGGDAKRYARKHRTALNLLEGAHLVVIQADAEL